MRLLFSFFLTCILSISVCPQDKLYTKRDKNYLREGAGSFYKLLEILPLNSELILRQKVGNWLEVTYKSDIHGFIASNCITEDNNENGFETKLAKTFTTSKVSRTGIAAAIKGLRGKSGETIVGDVDLLMSLTEIGISIQEYQKFKELLRNSDSENYGKLALEDLDLEIPEYDPLFSEQQIGIGIASRLVQEGVVNNTELMNYVNMIGALLVENSEFYDWDFKVLILNKDEVDGYACPGGFIFITRGALKNCLDEAELAALIAHEVAHVLREHGRVEMDERKTAIKMDAAFEELNQDLSEDPDSTTLMLEDMMVSTYEKIVHQRLLEYELEADKISAILCANAGYDPFGISRITSRLSQSFENNNDIFQEDYLAPNDMKKRAEVINSFVNENFSTESPGASLRDRLQELKRDLN